MPHAEQSNIHPHIAWEVTGLDDDASEATRKYYDVGTQHAHRPSARGVVYKQLRNSNVSDICLRDEEKQTAYCKLCWPNTYTLQDGRKATG